MKITIEASREDVELAKGLIVALVRAGGMDDGPALGIVANRYRPWLESLASRIEAALEHVAPRTPEEG